MIQVSLNSSLAFLGPVSGNGGFVKTGPGPLRLNANNTYTAPTIVSNGTVLVSGSQPSSQIILAGGTLAGNGTVGQIASTAGGTLNPSAASGFGTAVLGSSNVTLNSSTTYSVDLNGTTPGSGYDQLNVTGTVNLSNAVLSVSLGYVSTAGQTFTIINNDSIDPVVGKFSGLPEGKFFSAGGAAFSISYLGGSGNDVVLTRVNPPQFTSIKALANGFKQLQGQGMSNSTYTIQAASNLIPVVVWSNLGTTLANGSDVFSFNDTNTAALPMRFYRVLANGFSP